MLYVESIVKFLCIQSISTKKSTYSIDNPRNGCRILLKFFYIWLLKSRNSYIRYDKPHSVCSFKSKLKLYSLNKLKLLIVSKT